MAERAVTEGGGDGGREAGKGEGERQERKETGGDLPEGVGRRLVEIGGWWRKRGEAEVEVRGRGTVRERWEWLVGWLIGCWLMVEKEGLGEADDERE